jgi:hypothetical protein
MPNLICTLSEVFRVGTDMGPPLCEVSSMNDTTQQRLDKIEECLDGLEEMGKELKEEIEGMSEDEEMTDQTPTVLGKLDEILRILKHEKN